MSSVEFLQWADLIPDALILVSGSGQITAANRAARARAVVDAMAVGELLQDVVADPNDYVETFLRACRRSREPVLGALTFTWSTTRQRCEGALLHPPSEGNLAEVLLRIPDVDSTGEHFSLLDEKLVSLAREVERRKFAESQLRGQLEMAAFGRDIGMILAQADSLQQMLQRCAESFVSSLDAAFARIWTLDPSGNELLLQASAGMYTHLDGDHSRIRVGQYKIGLIAAEQKPHLTNAVIGDPRVHNQQWATKTGMVAFAGYPLIVDQRTVGVMALFAKHELDSVVLDAMATVANSVALGIERKRIESNLRQYTEALEQSSRRKDEFLAMLAHELRNPLAPIRTGLELLSLESGNDSETLKLMRDSLEHLVRLVDDLLDISRIMRDHIRVERESVELGELMRRAIQTIDSTRKSRQQTLEVSESSTPVWIHADAVRITQVLINVLGNAVKYTPAGGSISVCWSQDDDHGLITVTDTGIGIDPEFLPQVFELFAQADRSLDRSAGGLGIGLTLTHRLVTLHGGDITVVSAGLGKGSEFRIRLPLAAGPVRVADTSSDDHLIADRGFRILIVDDSAGSAKILRRLLSAIGQDEIEVAFDGPSAVEMARRFQPEIVFLDIGLPGLDGYQVAERIRSDPNHAGSYICALTGYGDEESQRRSKAAGIDRHLVKPVSLDDLKKVLAIAAQP